MRVLRGWVHGLWRTVSRAVVAKPQAFVAPRFSPGTRHKRAFNGNDGYSSGVSWLGMRVGVWLGGEIRSGRSRRCALVCGVHGFTGFTVEPRRDIR